MAATAEQAAHQTVPREIVITNRALEYGNIEAWTGIISSYMQKHPDHEVLILYEGEPVNSMLALYKSGQALNRNGFKVAVAAPDADMRDVPKLYRYLVEGAGPNFQRFIGRELHKVLKLF